MKISKIYKLQFNLIPDEVKQEFENINEKDLSQFIDPDFRNKFFEINDERINNFLLKWNMDIKYEKYFWRVVRCYYKLFFVLVTECDEDGLVGISPIFKFEEKKNITYYYFGDVEIKIPIILLFKSSFHEKLVYDFCNSFYCKNFDKDLFYNKIKERIYNMKCNVENSVKMRRQFYED